MQRTHRHATTASTHTQPDEARTMTSRRAFLRTAVASSILYGGGALPGTARESHASFAPVDKTVYANVMLPGGPDFRHLLPPAWSDDPASYGHQFWRNRAASFGLSNSVSVLRSHWNNAFDERSHNGTTFGISKQCGWLRQMWDAGHVAIINNVVGAESRDHEHCQLVMDQGNRTSKPNDFDRSGWGGRLASLANTNCVSLTAVPRHFCYGAHPSGDINRYDNQNLISAPDMRSVTLFNPSPAMDQRWDTQGQIARSLRSYYAGLSQSIPSDSPYRIYIDHEKELRSFGQIIDERLANVSQPYSLRRLFDYGLGRPLNNINFGKQLSNLYDALACNDILNMRVASLAYDGFDSHDGQAQVIEPRFNELFGDDQGLSNLWNSLPDDARQNVVFGFMGEFGRQLKANGGNGTDHGRGNSMMLIGQRVSGGVYGDQFPEEELSRLNDISPDIRGLTEFDRPFGAVCDWIKPGSQWSVFPDLGNSKLESGISMSSILT